MFTCPVCSAKCHTLIGVQNHLWHDHSETKVCSNPRHVPPGVKDYQHADPNIPRCSGLARAACAYNAAIGKVRKPVSEEQKLAFRSRMENNRFPQARLADSEKANVDI